jgi:hypothetical protein
VTKTIPKFSAAVIEKVCYKSLRGWFCLEIAMVLPGVGLLLFILDIYVIYLIVIGGSDALMKLVWILVVLLLPLIGPILYLVLGRGPRIA